MKKALITGITGQDGSYLTELLIEKGYEVHGIVRRISTFNTKRIDYLFHSRHYNKKFFTHYGDLTDPNSINRLVLEIKPDEIYNLAAQSHVKVSFEIPNYTSQVDALGSLYVLEAVRNCCPECKVYQASTSEMFGGIKGEIPKEGYDENIPFHPRSPYGVSKLFGYWITRNYREAYDIFGSNGILFNHESPRRGETFVTRKITKWCGDYLANPWETPPLQLGNLNAYRDWGHAKDFVRAMWMILQAPQADDWVVSTGETYTVKDFVEKCFDWMGKEIHWEGEGINEVGIVDDKKVVSVNPKYFRPTEVDFLLGNSRKIREELGWKPEYSFKNLVEDMMENDSKNRE
ncbi:MAG: GDP-mannose 4,6-dehydratase [Candidatus Coatesbacteria bacterium]|nr:GDP-mannose 4,6-dehydratase [Candidatus Coatesbacteria bacterium]